MVGWHLLLFSGVASAATYRLHHRILDPDAQLAPSFAPRATVDVSNGVPIFNPDSEGVLSLQNNLDRSWYQIALEHPSHKHSNDWFIQSVRACHALGNKADLILLHSASSEDVFGFDYFVQPLAHDGSCASNARVEPSQVAFGNTTVAWKSVTIESTVALRTPPRLSEKGEPIQPPPEPTFFQKYWMWIVGFMILFLAVAPDPGQQEDQGPSK
ncbi:hypothetical protein FRC02_007676 [Tulasnella sp. 418]|nr:hypothetical protein FRC02_007676 [Tulasnella sp. 418]